MHQPDYVIGRQSISGFGTLNSRVPQELLSKTDCTLIHTIPDEYQATTGFKYTYPDTHGGRMRNIVIEAALCTITASVPLTGGSLARQFLRYSEFHGTQVGLHECYCSQQ